MPNTKEFTLTRALVELKLYDNKIAKATSELKPVSYSVNKIVIDYRQTPEEFISNYTSQFQSLTDLRKNKVALKNALMKANAETVVEIAGKKYTILEALNKKADIQVDQHIINVLKNGLARAIQQSDNINRNIENNIETTINAKSTATNQSKDYIETVRNSYENQKAVLVNDKEIEKYIVEKEEEITNFLAEVDYALSEINAITKITVELA